MLRTLAPELDHCAPCALQAERLPHLTTVIHMEATEEPGFHRFDAIPALGGASERTPVSRRWLSCYNRMTRQHPVHIGHDRFAERSDVNT